MNIPLFKPYIGHEEMNAVSRVLKSKKLTRGQEVEGFEKEFASYVGKKYAVAVNSGTSGLHVSVRALGWKQGDEIITTPFSYIASSNALLYENITPVFVDIDPNTLNIDVNKIEEKITAKTKGIMLVHVFGLPVDAAKIKSLKEKHNLTVLEDACEATGPAGTDFLVSHIGEASVYGFHENKQMTTCGEGGMIVTDDIDIAEKCRSMRDQGRSMKKDWIKNVILGYNFRLTEVQAAVGREQLKRLDSMLAKRELVANQYQNLLSSVDDLRTPLNPAYSKRSWFVYFVIFETTEMRDYVHKSLGEAGISSSVNYFPPIYYFPMYKDCNRGCNNTESISKLILVLPMFYEMTDIDIVEVVNVIKSAISKR